jgi:hypothetical protein
MLKKPKFLKVYLLVALGAAAAMLFQNFAYFNNSPFQEDSILLANNFPLLPKAAGLKPDVISLGRGCSDNNCIWMEADKIEADFKIDLRNLESSQLWTIPQEKMSVYKQPNGRYLISFRVSEIDALYELNSKGLNAWIVNQGSLTWTLPHLVK